MEYLGKTERTVCQSGASKLTGDELQTHLETIHGWELIEAHHIKKTYRFDNFKKALLFANRVGDLSERQKHHPSICIRWGEAEIELFTHAIDGLHKIDFSMAAKIDDIYSVITAKKNDQKAGNWHYW